MGIGAHELAELFDVAADLRGEAGGGVAGAFGGFLGYFSSGAGKDFDALGEGGFEGAEPAGGEVCGVAIAEGGGELGEDFAAAAGVAVEEAGEALGGDAGLLGVGGLIEPGDGDGGGEGIGKMSEGRHDCDSIFGSVWRFASLGGRWVGYRFCLLTNVSFFDNITYIIVMLKISVEMDDVPKKLLVSQRDVLKVVTSWAWGLHSAYEGTAKSAAGTVAGELGQVVERMSARIEGGGE